MGSLLEHPRWGLNATQPCCFFCSQPLPIFAFLGGYITEPTPAQMTLDYAPCPGCERQQQGGIVLIECGTEPGYPAQPKVAGLECPYPTGRWMLLPAEHDKLRQVFSESAVEYLQRERRAYVAEPRFEQIMELCGGTRNREKAADPARV